MSRFVDGNMESLHEMQSVYTINIQEYLRDFFKKYYCASNMCLVVQAGIEINKLERWVSEIFIKIPETGTVVPPDFSQDFYRFPFDDVLFCGSYKMASSETVYQLKVTWTLPPTRQKWQKKSFEFVTWILTHDGHGSLIQYLKQRLWGLQIYQGLGGFNFDDNSASRLMTLNFDLTFDGHR
jgi:secreted Zn-dependent insulinase-like peptidase